MKKKKKLGLYASKIKHPTEVLTQHSQIKYKVGHGPDPESNIWKLTEFGST